MAEDFSVAMKGNFGPIKAKITINMKMNLYLACIIGGKNIWRYFFNSLILDLLKRFEKSIRL